MPTPAWHRQAGLASLLARTAMKTEGLLQLLLGKLYFSITYQSRKTTFGTQRLTTKTQKGNRKNINT